ncbi:MAG TPA: FtsH protease activity modulator HflK [Dokdonella sp.]|uniref:FtsH protease activity modulator HflK n=2 Tax=Dokdonella sp. TaxID=2291710 RepID=UPI002C82EDE9|nr:FtsH protease activity modulator HflK [Dokdonella sp.]HQZ62756.1 FtsH protease activity modulator HflK [Dokdonella sp.]
MAWNEPGGGKQRDPWRDNKDGGGKNDLDDAINRAKEMLGRLFGGGGSGGGRGGSSGNSRGGGAVLAIVGLLIAWVFFDSFVQIDARQQGVVLRFGEYARTMPPGFNLKWPRPVESVTKVDATQIRAVSDTVRMLTRDENIVQVEFNVQYQVDDPTLYLYSTRDPDETLKQAAESAVREIIGTSELDAIMPDQRVEATAGDAPVANPSAELALQSKKVVQQTLERYKAGLLVTELNFQNVRPPQEVKDSFDDAISAREDRQRASNIADAYAKRVVPEARGEAARILAEAKGYEAERIARAQGDAERFNLIASEYRAAPEVTRKRLYIETLQQVVSGTPKVIDFTGGRNLLQVPVPQQTAEPLPATTAAAAISTESSKGKN